MGTVVKEVLSFGVTLPYNQALFSDSNSFKAVMASLSYTIACRDICMLETELDILFW